jgi:hypothetical protein
MSSKNNTSSIARKKVSRTKVAPPQAKPLIVEDTRPVIYVITGFLSEAVDAVVKQLAKINELDIYRDSETGRLVHGVILKGPSGLERNVQQAYWAPLPYSTFLVALERTFRFVSAERTGVTDSGMVRLESTRTISAPPTIVRAIFETPQYWEHIQVADHDKLEAWWQQQGWQE